VILTDATLQIDMLPRHEGQAAGQPVRP
jgi:hypothetical protein